jgi:hypothetical protein
VNRTLGPSTFLNRHSTDDQALLWSLEYAYDGAIRGAWGREALRAPHLLRKLTTTGSLPSVEVIPDLPIRLVHLEARAALSGRLELAVAYLLKAKLPVGLVEAEVNPHSVERLDTARSVLEEYWGSEPDYAFLRWYAGRREAFLRHSRGVERHRVALRRRWLTKQWPRFVRLLSTFPYTATPVRSATSILQIVGANHFEDLVDWTSLTHWVIRDRFSLTLSQHDELRILG